MYPRRTVAQHCAMGCSLIVHLDYFLIWARKDWHTGNTSLRKNENLHDSQRKKRQHKEDSFGHSV